MFYASEKKFKASWEADAGDWDSFHFTGDSKLLVKWIIKENLKFDWQIVA